MIRTAITATLLLLAPLSLTAQSFSVLLEGARIGQLTVDANSLSSTLDSTPLGVADGQFTASAKQVQRENGDIVTQYLSNSSNKGRTISVLHAAGRAVETTVSPSSDATDLSNIANVPSPMSDPVAVMTALIGAGGCPQPMTMYDGRRVIAISTAGSTQSGATTTCEMSYRVTGGPGHMSPFRFRTLQLQLDYTGGTLSEMRAGAAGFEVAFVRQ